MPIKVGIVEDNPTMRKRLAEHFRYYDEVTITTVAESGSAFLNSIGKVFKKEIPDVILMDIEMPGISGIETAQKVKEFWPNVDIIMYTVFENDARIFDSIKAGASGYILKDEPMHHVVEAIKEMYKGGAPISTSVAKRLMNHIREEQEPEQGGGNDDDGKIAFELTKRELEILEKVTEGKSNKEIAADLFVSPWTVRTHIKHIYKKMHVSTRASAVRTAIKHNMIK